MTTTCSVSEKAAYDRYRLSVSVYQQHDGMVKWGWIMFHFQSLVSVDSICCIPFQVTCCSDTVVRQPKRTPCKNISDFVQPLVQPTSKRLFSISKLDDFFCFNFLFDVFFRWIFVWYVDSVGTLIFLSHLVFSFLATCICRKKE